MSEPQRIGVLLVHGVGDQGRFDHLQNVADALIKTLIATRTPESVNVIMPGIGGAPLSIMIRNADGGRDQLDLHEMWWRDLGQKQSLGAILRFWWWAASLAGTKGYFETPRQGYENPSSPSAARRKLRLSERFLLFFKVTYCFILLAPINLVISFTHFLPGVRRIQFIHSVFTHFSSVQMYQERVESQRGTLCDYDQSRRVSIQRRFSEVLTTMAEFNYDRWYIAGHSLGSVIAMKGLMYSDHAFAKLINYNRWCHPAFEKFKYVAPNSCGSLYDEPRMATTWLSPQDAVKTECIFRKLRGLITYGSPLEMFATVWPAIVPLKKHTRIRKDFEWINFFDVVDVVGSPLKSFSFEVENGEVVNPINVPCKASSLITSAHIKYWTARHPPKKEGLLAAVITWMLSGNSFPQELSQFKWYPDKTVISKRKALAYAQWGVALFIGCLIWPFAVIGILFALRYAISTILHSASFVLEYFVDLDGARSSNKTTIFYPTTLKKHSAM